LDADMYWAKRLVVLLASLQVALGLLKNSHQVPDQRQDYFIKRLKDYEIVVPTRIDKDGGFISHVIRHDHGSPAEGRNAHYKIPAFGKTLHLQLTKDAKFLSPGLIIEEGTTQRQLNHNCHFTGRLKDQPGSTVFVSNCRGLEGVIHDPSGDHLFIEPVLGRSNDSHDGQHPHLVYRRSALEDPPDDHLSCDIHEKISLARRKREPYLELIRETSHERQRRSISSERNVEVLVVADKSMYEFHKDDLESYLLTVMNMEDQADLKIMHHAGETIESFCKWATTVNPKSDKHPNHHDLAILVTRHDICKGINEPCGTLGLSQVNGLCTRTKSCNINEDSGLLVAYTIAHEIGHNFGMLHDGDDNKCRVGFRRFIMSPALYLSGRPQFWSTCSRDYVRRFLLKGWGWCLNDVPSEHPDLRARAALPGTIYDADHQCRVQYGRNSSHCKGVTDMCSTLWCKVGYSCQSRLEPAADGSECGKKKVCYHGECIDIQDIPKCVDGGWGSWSNWSECSRTCGGGVSYSQRYCDNPRPVASGKYCIGKWKKYVMCNVQKCSASAQDFREEQCTKFNSKVFRNRKWDWKPATIPRRPCELHCSPKGIYGLYIRKKFSDRVIDGTRCHPSKRDVCIDGKCQYVGCDSVLHSDAKEDRCGVCHGDGSTCETVNSLFNQTTGIGYVETIVIPEGARNIRVEEVAGAPNYLALRSSTGKYLLNGHWYIQWSGEYKAAGTIVRYTRKHNKETFVADGPTNSDLHIMLLFQTRNPGVTFKYTISKKGTIKANETVEFIWRYSDWSPCSTSCGVGNQRSNMICFEKTGESPVDDKYCNGTVKPDDKQRVCNENPCPATWYMGPWQSCSKSCGKGMAVRSVLCVRSIKNDEQIALKDEACTKTKPKSIRICSKQKCPPPWTIGKWTKCSVTCGQGTQRRTVVCSHGNNTQHPCDKNSKPITWQYCNSGDCKITSKYLYSKVSITQNMLLLRSPYMDEANVVDREHESPISHGAAGIVTCKGGKCRQWIRGHWSKCSVKCGQGVQTRRVYCPGSHRYCDHRTKPAKHRKCRMKPCLAWKAGQWTKCSATCGSGMRKRIVKCYNTDTGRVTGGCSKSQRPKHYQRCSSGECPAKKKGDLN
ncbi:hypothetical protein QZH41_016375, partial [Actinostola sp. cb2023]